MELGFVKKFLRVDFDDDDEYIQFLIQAAREYIVDAVGRFDDNSYRHKLLALNIISNLYDTRSFTIIEGTNSSEKVQYAIKSMMLQLQLEGENNE